MADVHTPEQRSFNMSRIRSKNTKPELVVRKFLFSRGFRYRLHDRTLPGKPDIVLKKYHVAIFVHGCFWHGHKHCKYFVIPKTDTDKWIKKITSNRARDVKNVRTLKRLGLKVIVVRECDIKGKAPFKKLNKISDLIKLNGK